MKNFSNLNINWENFTEKTPNTGKYLVEWLYSDNNRLYLSDKALSCLSITYFYLDINVNEKKTFILTQCILPQPTINC